VRHGVDAWERAQLSERLRAEAKGRVRIRVLHAWRDQIELDRVFSIEPRIRGQLLLQAAQQQTGTDEERRTRPTRSRTQTWRSPTSFA
jgi:hypothetical protein